MDTMDAYRKRSLHITTLRHTKGFEWMMFEEPKQKPSCLANRQWLGIPPMETAGTESRCAGVYEQYKTLRQDMIAYQTAKQNVDRILGTELPEPEQKATPQACSTGRKSGRPNERFGMSKRIFRNIARLRYPESGIPHYVIKKTVFTSVL